MVVMYNLEFYSIKKVLCNCNMLFLHFLHLHTSLNLGIELFEGYFACQTTPFTSCSISREILLEKTPARFTFF